MAGQTRGSYEAGVPVEARYRNDGYGQWVVLLPQRCPSGEHVLACGYTAEESDSVLRVTNAHRP
jgi:hypothetical protein